MPAFKEPEVSCRLPNMPLTDTTLSLLNKAQPSTLSSNLRQSVACDILHASLQCQDTVSSVFPYVKEKPVFRALLSSSLTHHPNNIRQKALSLSLCLLLFPQLLFPLSYVQIFF
jgi:hypothetical protein